MPIVLVLPRAAGARLLAGTVAVVALSGVLVTGAGSPAGATTAAPAGATTTRAFSTSFTDTCHVVGRTWPVPAVVSGQAPVSVARGAQFRLTRLRFAATIPAEVATMAYDTGARRAVLRLRVVNARGVGVLPAVRDVVAGEVTTAPLVLRRGRPLPFEAPEQGGLAAGFTAGATRGVAELQAGAVRATVQLQDAQGSALGEFPVTCGAPDPAVVVTTVRVS